MAAQQKSGCSSVVEHFLAKEDVARSNRVTRSIVLIKNDEAVETKDGKQAEPLTPTGGP